MQRLATTTRRRRRGLCAAAFLVLPLIVPSSPGSLVEKIVVVVNDVPHNSTFRRFAKAKLKQDVQLDADGGAGCPRGDDIPHQPLERGPSAPAGGGGSGASQ